RRPIGRGRRWYCRPANATPCFRAAGLDRHGRPVRTAKTTREGNQRGALCSRTRIVALAVSFEAADVLLAIELHAKLFDELQLGLQKIDVFFFINQKVVIKLLGDEVMS